MPDITMCEGGTCPLRKTCYRHTANPTPMRQAYFLIPPHNLNDCQYYWKDKERDE